jgi:hypothetical protein
VTDRIVHAQGWAQIAPVVVFGPELQVSKPVTGSVTLPSYCRARESARAVLLYTSYKNTITYDIHVTASLSAGLRATHGHQ